MEFAISPPPAAPSGPFDADDEDLASALVTAYGQDWRRWHITL
ncbi:hypothetical protein [Massilia violaceinigra]|nr:hypothetical protein [Massilia violaceinigra]